MNLSLIEFVCVRKICLDNWPNMIIIDLPSRHSVLDVGVATYSDGTNTSWFALSAQKLL